MTGVPAFPKPIEWRSSPLSVDLYEAYIQDVMMGWISKRQAYCDRGHWQVNISLPDIDSADGFPRYYMRLETAKQETEDFLRWRLWRIRAGSDDTLHTRVLT